MNRSVERKLTLGFGTALAVLFVVTAAAWWNVVRFQGTHYWVDRSRDVLNCLEQALSDVLGMHASSRGYVLTGNEEVLQPFQAGKAHLAATLNELRRLTADDPQQHARLDALEPLAARAREQMDDRVAARRARGLDATGETAAYLEGQQRVEDFRRAIRAMADHERRLLDDRLDRTGRLGRLTVWTIAASCALAAGAAAFAARRIRADLRRRREAEAELQESLRRVEDLYHNAPCGYHSLDREGRFVAINDRALTWLGYRSDEVIGRMTFADVLTPESAAVFAERFPRFMASGVAQNVEYQWRRKDGTTLPVVINATAVRDERGAFVASRATVFDITDIKRVENERDNFFALSRDLLLIAGFDGRFRRLNQEWERTFGFTNEELLARPLLDFVHPEDRARTEAEVARLAQGEETIAFENRYRCRDGTYRWLLWNASALPAERAIYASGRDITERKQSDERITRLHSDLATHVQRLEAANRELEAFSYSVSHDLRAPLRHIDGFASLLTKRANAHLDDEGRRYLATISRAARQMGLLIDDLLAFSRIGRAPLRIEPVKHDALVAAVIAEGHYDTPERKIAWDIGPLPDVQGDISMLRQVWTNLVDNAVKYSGKVPAPQIAIRGEKNLAAGEFVFSVRDNGVGFDMAYADKLFGVFQRLHAATEFEGTGIGLANVRRIVFRHGGRTWAEGRVDEGATFYFSIPATVTPAQSPT